MPGVVGGRASIMPIGVFAPQFASNVFGLAGMAFMPDSTTFIAVDPEREAEKAYLSLLATRLNLDKSLVAHIRANAAPADAVEAYKAALRSYPDMQEARAGLKRIEGGR